MLNKKDAPYSPRLSPEAFDLISRLLSKDPRTRIGCGSKGIGEVKDHLFFELVDWELVRRRLVKPPLVPELYRRDANFRSYSELTVG